MAEEFGRVLEDDFIASLRSFLDETEAKELDVSSDQQAIMSKEQANYFLKKLAEIRHNKDEINEFADMEIAKTTTRVETWRERELAKQDREEEYLTSLLEAFAKQQISEGKSKSVKLPYGTIGFRKQQPEYQWPEDIDLVRNLNDAGLYEYIKSKPIPMKAEVKKAAVVKDGKLYIDGKEVPGVVVVEREDKFEVKI